MALMASMRPSCTTLPAALCEKRFSRGEPRQRFLNVSGLPSECDFGLSWLCLGELLAALGRLLAALGLPRQPVAPFGLRWAAVRVSGPRRRASHLDLATFETGPGWLFSDFHTVFANAFAQSLDCAVAWLTAPPLRRSSPVVCFCSIVCPAPGPGAAHLPSVPFPSPPSPSLVQVGGTGRKAFSINEKIC